MLVHDPIAPERSDRETLAPRPTLAPGARIGLLANGKPNADVLLHVIHARIAREYPELGPPIVLNKGTEALGPSNSASEAQFERLTSGAIAVLAASGD
jgi:hypothetical protein